MRRALKKSRGMFNVLFYYSDCWRVISVFNDIANVSLSFSSYKCEAVGHRPAVLPDHHDEDRSHQAHRVHGVFEKVSVPSPIEAPGPQASFDLKCIE